MTSTSLRADELDYELPPSLIATRPAEPRDAARLLVYRRATDTVEHRHVRDLPEYIQPGDLMVFNTTAVAPARLEGHRSDTGGRIEGLFIEEKFIDEQGGHEWRVALRSNGRLASGQRITLHATEGGSTCEIELLHRDGPDWIVRPPEGVATADLLETVGRTPLPPYILRARGEEPFDDRRDRGWYQTVYADPEKRESVAAPTAGLHYTADLLDAVEARGARRCDVILHVGPGTFRPISVERVQEHPMHSERYEVPAATLRSLRECRASGGRVIAVGTTTVRTLESLPDPLPEAVDNLLSGSTDLLICPPHEFRHVDAMMTNFHLPRSTLLALVAAMIGLPRLMEVYREAVRREYRFYSYGDAMLLLP